MSKQQEELIEAVDRAMKKPIEKRIRKLGELVDACTSEHYFGPTREVDDAVWSWAQSVHQAIFATVCAYHAQHPSTRKALPDEDPIEATNKVARELGAK